MSRNVPSSLFSRSSVSPLLASLLMTLGVAVAVGCGGPVDDTGPAAQAVEQQQGALLAPNLQPSPYQGTICLAGDVSCTPGTPSLGLQPPRGGRPGTYVVWHAPLGGVCGGNYCAVGGGSCQDVCGRAGSFATWDDVAKTCDDHGNEGVGGILGNCGFSER